MTAPTQKQPFRTRLARAAATAAGWASRATGRGSGGMIGGLVAQKIDPDILTHLTHGRPVILVTGTNGKSTTTRMLAAAARRAAGGVCTNSGGDNMDAGIITALLADQDSPVIVLEVDELHVPHIADVLQPAGLVLLNLSRDQLDRCGEIARIETALRQTVARHPDMRVIANCDDVAITSAAFDATHVTWVACGGNWNKDSMSCPRSGSHITHQGGDWWASRPDSDGRQLRRPQPDWSVDGSTICGPDGQRHQLNLKIPGAANIGNAAQAIAAAHTILGADTTQAAAAVEEVQQVAGRYATVNYRGKQLHLLLAKNPAGWQEALTMLNKQAGSIIVAVNGQTADGVDLSWLWDVNFEELEDLPGTQILATGQRGTDLSVRLTYAGIEHQHVADAVAALDASTGPEVEILANYTAFRDLNKYLRAHGGTSHA